MTKHYTESQLFEFIISEQELFAAEKELHGPKPAPTTTIFKEIEEERNQPQMSPTGSLRYNKDKYKMSTIPPQFLEGLAEVLTKGEQKYGRYNFAKGNHVSVPYDSAMRHINAFMKGQDLDGESNSHHLFHAAVNLMMMWLYQTKFPEMDDREFKDEV
jgi:hypothetical protein